VTIRKEEGLDQTLEAAQEDEEDEHSEKCLNAFSQKVEEVVALKLIAKEEEGGNGHSEEWLDTFSQEAEAKEEEEADNICFVDLWEQIEALEERVKVQSMHIQQVKLETNEEGMGDFSDLPMSQKNLQLGRLQK
jgi:hypothetical protein